MEIENEILIKDLRHTSNSKYANPDTSRCVISKRNDQVRGGIKHIQYFPGKQLNRTDPFEASIGTQPSVLSLPHFQTNLVSLGYLTFWSSRHFVTNDCHSFNGTACTKVIEKFLRRSRIIYLPHIYRTPARKKTTKQVKMSKEGPTKNLIYSDFLRTSAESSRLPVT